MTVHIRSVSTATSDSAYDNAVPVTAPTGLRSTDVLVAIVFQSYVAAGNSVAWPSGFTVTGGSGSVSGTTGIWAQTAYKVAGASEPASYTFTATGNPSAEIMLFAIAGADPSSPFGATPVYTAGSPAQSGQTCPSVTTSPIYGDLLICAVSCISSSAQYTSYPSNMTAGPDFLDPTNKQESTYAYESMGAGGTSTGVQSFTHTASAQWVGVSLTLREAVVPILAQQFGTGLGLAVEVAWGAQPQGSQSGWVWSDITHDVQARTSDNIKITMGRSDEASEAQPAALTLKLNNRAGSYSQSASSINYPNVRKGTPIRVRLLYQGGTYLRYQGYVTSWQPVWDSTGRDAYVQLTANGVTRRVQQGQQVLGSALTRGMPTYTANPPVGYWPCEDGTSSTQLASGLPGGPPMTFSRAVPTLATYSAFLASNPLPQANGSSWHAPIPTYNVALPAALQLQFFLAVPSTGGVDQSFLVEIHATGTPRWVLMYHAGGALSLKCYDYAGNKLQDTGPIGYAVNGQNMWVVVQLSQSGSNVNWGMTAYAVTSGGAGGQSGTFSNASIGAAFGIHVCPDGLNTTVTIGQIIVQALVDSNVFALNNYVNAWIGESPTARLQRLAGEQGEHVAIQGSSAMTMGAQLPKTFIQLLRECEALDAGLLADGLFQGLTYFCRSNTESTAAVLTLDASQGQIYDFAPVDDDLLNINTYTATRQNGSSAVATDQNGPFGVNTIGEYPGSNTINCQYDYPTVADYAGWMVHRGTTFGPTNSVSYRYPTVPLRIQHSPSLIGPILGTGSGTALPLALLARMDLLNVGNVRSQMQPLTISEQIQGYTEVLDQFRWEITLNCTPYDVARVATIAQETGDNTEFVWRIDTDGSTVVNDVAPGATTITVATPSATVFTPIWTNAPDDCPMVVNIGDIPVTVTAISGVLSPQTFTVTPSTVTKTLKAGTAVTVWNQSVLGL